MAETVARMDGKRLTYRDLVGGQKPSTETTTMTNRSLAALAAALTLAACADSADNIPAAYVSPVAYQDYSCSQLGAELSRVSARAAEVAGVQDEAASRDEGVMAIGLIVFLPALFFLEGDTGRESELGRLHGEVEAIEATATRKNCVDLLDEVARQRALAEEHRKRQAEIEAMQNACRPHC